MSDETQQSAESSERQLCIKCLTPNDPSANFCVKCGAPLGPLAFTSPFESNFAQGSSFREAAERPRNFAVVLGVWLIFGTMALGGIIVVVAGGTSNYFLSVLFSIFAVISLVILWKTTRNYIAEKRGKTKSDA
jgi:hypothetical protein